MTVLNPVRTRTTTITLPNGLRVVHRRCGPVPVVGLAVAIRSGFRDDPAQLDGLAHVAEHVVLGDDRADHTEVPGWSVSAATRADLTLFYSMGPRADLSAAMRVEARRLTTPSWSPRSFTRHVNTVLDEIVRSRELNPYGRFPIEHAVSGLFSDTPDTHDGYGTRDTVRSISSDHCSAFVADHYRPENVVIGVAGDIDETALAELVDRHFSALSRGSVTLEHRRPSDGTVAGGHQVVRAPGAPCAGAAVAFPLPDPRDVPAYCAVIAAVAVLVESGVGVLRGLLDAGPVRPMSVSGCCGRMRVPFEASGPDVAIVSVLTASDDDASQCPDLIERALLEAADGRVPAATVAAALRAWSARTARQLTSIETQAVRLACFDHVADRPDLVDQLPDLVECTEPTAVAAAADRLLRGGRSVVVLHRSGS